MTRYDCEIFPAQDMRVTWGVNHGDRLGDPDLCAPGDVYTLTRTDSAQIVSLDLDGQMTVLASPPGSPLRPGMKARARARLGLMANDGDRVELLVLESDDAWLALPLHPIRPDTGYALIWVDRDDPGPALVQMVQGCLGAGMRITLANGALVPVEELEPDMPILTRDHGAQPLRWVGKVTLRAQGQFAPVIVAPGALGNLNALVLAPLHRIFLYQRGDARLAGRSEILVQARHLVDGARITQREGGFATYFSLAFDAHQIVYAEGVPVESLLVSRAIVQRLPDALARDLTTRFPRLDQRAHFAPDIGALP